VIETEKPELLMAQLADECPSATEPVLRNALMRSVQEFSHSNLINAWMWVPTQAKVSAYPLEDHVCSGMAINSISVVEYCGRCLSCVEDCKGCQSGFSVDDLHHITLVGSAVPTRSAERDLRVKAVLRVKDRNCEIPKDLLIKYREALFDGAMFYLLRQKKKDWSDFSLATYYQNQFLGKISSAQCAAQSKHVRGNNRILGQRALLG